MLHLFPTYTGSYTDPRLQEMVGFSRSKYKSTVPPASSVAHDASDEHHYMLSTQFQPCDARRAFPCFDEPALKASFELSIEIPENQIALCNTPEKETVPSSRPASSNDWNWKVINFEKSPVMSTYLYTWAVGDFEYVEAKTERKYNGKPLRVRVYTTKSLEEQGRYALEHAWKIIDLLSEDYPLPKMDLVAVHDFATGAMEGTSMVLFDERNSDQRFRSRIANMVGHELAHQWAGNLVTMEWICHLGWLAETMSEAFNLDSIRNSHPIEVPVRSALEVAQIFDAISYLKGSWVVRMLSAHLSGEVFLHGVAKYLKKHADGNANTNDLWSALSDASGQDVNQIMGHGTKSIGLSVVIVIEEESDQITLQQSGFLLSGDVKQEEDQTIWTIPLALRLALRPAKSASGLSRKTLFTTST
ncbi:hypothetical protein LTR81_023729 [Elasticomyces elasticus]